MKIIICLISVLTVMVVWGYLTPKGSKSYKIYHLLNGQYILEEGYNYKNTFEGKPIAKTVSYEVVIKWQKEYNVESIWYQGGFEFEIGGKDAPIKKED